MSGLQTTEEILAIVDENDNIIGSKPRKELEEQDIFRIAGIMLVNKKGEFLIQKRHSNKKTSPNLWAPSAAGHVRHNETYESTIHREIAEEINAKSLPPLIPYEKIFRESMDPTTGKTRRRFSQGFLAIYDAANMPPLVPDGIEVSEIRWVSLGTLKSELQKTPEIFIRNMPEILTSIESFFAKHPNFLRNYNNATEDHL
jgi:isopentenyldiphosphate isomerase